ncbi:bile acid:sodium symporter [Phycicoccus endophyticus]|uniref:Bile acid:sodium symporter n=1 Tax=Phycicoccus endophyticus TaxID=1690220 RepID=A0A7G9R1Z2_9MICO|nr:bile acid:sodium symporter [Phycicoccus endophyticus]NHI19753.1 bile acid:sodium symporter family protein [Phycicoccus endophyticus]QNN49617.1 bile acid:sodium symporter [Phycicoccus endophyticus]
MTGATEALVAVARAGMLTFVVVGMVTTGLALTVRGVTRPLRDVRLVAGTLVVNFAVVPAVVVLLVRLLPVEPATGTALVLVACCAGAPFLPTLARLVHGDLAISVAVMVLLMVVTVVYAPLVVPVAVEGASVSAGPIALSLVVVMLLPLAAGLGLRAWLPEVAASWARVLAPVPTGAIVLALVAGLLAAWRDIVGSVGSWIFVGTLGLLAIAYVVGALVNRTRSTPDRRLLGLAAAQRNIAAALVVAASMDPDVVVRTLVAAILSSVVLLVAAARLGAGAVTAEPQAGASPTAA